MPALKGKSIDAFFARRDTNVYAALVFGPDAGLVRERAEALARSVVEDLRDPFNVVDFTDNDLKGSPARLAEEAEALSFVGGERLIRLRTQGDVAAPALKILIDGVEGGRLKSNAFVVVEGGDLQKASKLRKAFESAKTAVAIPCYADDPRDVADIAEAAARKEGLTFEPDALERLVALTGEDRGVSRAEIDKLLLYVGPSDSREGDAVTLAHVDAALADTLEDAFDDAADAAADGAAARLAVSLGRLRAQGASPIALIRALQRNLAVVAAARAAVDAGASPTDAVARLRPPVFFKRRAALARRAARWRAGAIAAAQDALLEAELAAKRAGAPQREIAERAAIAIAKKAARSA